MRHHVRILAGRLDRGAGSHVYHQQLARRLVARGHRVSVVCFQAGPEIHRCAETVEIPPAPFDQARFVWRLASLFQHWHCTVQLLRRRLPPADIVIGGEHLFLKGHHRLFPKTPWIYLPHSLTVGQEIESYNLTPLMERMSTLVYVSIQRWALSCAQRTLRFTHNACEALEARYGLAVHPRFFINPMGTEVPPRRGSAASGGAVRLLWVGRLIPGKRIDLALDALAEMRGENWQFDVVGDGTARDSLAERARQLRLDDRVRFHGFQPDPGPFYRQADLLLFPSRLENFPVTMLEAMSHGVPCLAMRGDGIRFHTAHAEIIRHGADGFLADSDEDFRRQLQSLLRDRQALEAAGEAARAVVERRYSWDAHLDRYQELFAELISETDPKKSPQTSEVG